MNELFFLFHTILVLGFVFGARHLGSSALTVIIALQAVLANLFVVKGTSLFGFSVTCSDVFAVGGIVALNLLQERFGFDAAKKAVRISFYTLVFFFCMAKAHLFYQPSNSDTTHAAFEQIFSSSFRIIVASIGVYFIVQRLDVTLYAFLRKVLGEGRFFLRLGASLLITQLLDTILFSFFGLYGLVSSVFDIIVLSFGVKSVVILISTLFAAFKKKENYVSSV